MLTCIPLVGMFAFCSGDKDSGMVLILGVYTTRLLINLGWLLHVGRHQDISILIKALWVLMLLLEGFAGMFLGGAGIILSSFGVVGLTYWMIHVVKPYRDQRMFTNLLCSYSG